MIDSLYLNIICLYIHTSTYICSNHRGYGVFNVSSGATEQSTSQASHLTVRLSSMLGCDPEVTAEVNGIC